jgi:hypothetical protein
MATITAILAYIQANPGTVVAVLTWLQAVTATLAAENHWRWAEVVSKCLAALPAINLAGLASAFKKPVPPK